MGIQRYTEKLSVAVDTVVADAAAFHYGAFAGGTVYLPAGSSVTTLTWYGSNDGVTFYALYDGFGNAVTTTIAAGQGCPIPEECYGCAQLKAASDADGTINLSLKS